MLEAMATSLAGSTLGAFAQVGLGKLVDVGLIQPENVDQKLERMERTLFTVRSLIRCTNEGQIAYQEWQNLLQEYEDAGYNVEDLMDLKKMGLRSKLSEREVVDVQAKLEDISKNIDRFQDKALCKPQTTMDDRFPLGRHNDIIEVIAMLDAPDQPSTNFTIISINGVIGVGKTTLAQVMYNHQGFIEPFEYRIWVSVPTTYDIIQLTRAILDEVTSQSQSQITALSTLQRRLKELLKGKKVLLVLDDVCNFKKEEWDALLKPFGRTGSKIIVTTGSPVVSKQLVHAYKGKQYELKCLRDDDFLLLLTKEVHGNGVVVADPQLQSIARQCKGIPLAAKIIGGLLAAEVNPTVREHILSSRIVDNNKIKEKIVSAVRWSYCKVPLHLRQAFAYCSIFPIFYKFEKDKIIKMWMGEGLIIPDQAIETLEDAGSSYVDQLLENYFLQINNDSRYMIQDSVHELAQSILGKRFLKLERADKPTKYIRHVLQTCEDIQNMTLEASDMCTGIRTLLLPGAYTKPVIDVRLDRLNYEKLRVLDLSGTQITELTECIGNWKHLRFLDLSNTLLKSLPRKIVNLCMLQTLRLKNCSKLLRLPANIGKLGSLRHLELGKNSRLSSMPSGIGNLTSLQTINYFIVSVREGQLNELENMNNIRGSLCIKKLEKVQDSRTVSGAKLDDKEHLDKLELQWTTPDEAVKSEKVVDLLMNSRPTCLKELILQNYGGKSFPGWIGNPLSHKLTTISFSHCPSCIRLPCLGNLPNLKELRITEMPNLKEVNEVFLGDGLTEKFPCLETLKICDVISLTSFLGDGLLDESDMPRLRDLTLENCPVLTVIPSLHHRQSLRILEVTECAKLKVKEFLTDEQHESFKAYLK